MLLGDVELASVELGSLRTSGSTPVNTFTEDVTQVTITLDFLTPAGRTCMRYPVVVANVGRLYYPQAVRIETIRETL